MGRFFIIMRRNFNKAVSDLQGISNMGIRLTLKNGSTLDMEDFNINGNVISAKNGRKALLNDVDYIELDTSLF